MHRVCYRQQRNRKQRACANGLRKSPACGEKHTPASLSALNQGESGAEIWGGGREAFATWWAWGRHRGFTWHETGGRAEGNLLSPWMPVSCRGERVECRLGPGDPAGPLCPRGYPLESPVLAFLVR